MTDQQTSRMNITEALDRLLAILPTGDSPLPSQRLVKTWVPDVAEAADAVRDILANPRSDAVTARDEPSTVEALKRDHPERLALADALGDMLQYEYPDKYAMGFALLSRLAAQGVVVREARAASASVPPLDVRRLARAMYPNFFDKQTEAVQRELIGTAEKLAAAYAAETPEQGR